MSDIIKEAFDNLDPKSEERVKKLVDEIELGSKSNIWKKIYKGYNKKEQEVCWLIWGGVPVDHEWAKGTKVFKEAYKMAYPAN